MKFNIQRKFQNNKKRVIKNYSFIIVFVLITYISSNKLIDFKNSMKLLDFNYYHTTEVFSIIK